MNNVEFIVANAYGESRASPVFTKRAVEFRYMKAWMAHYGRVLTNEDFDWAIAERFGGGCEYEWPYADDDPNGIQTDEQKLAKWNSRHTPN